MHVVTHIGALHPENHIFGDVGSVIGDPLQIAGDEERVESLADRLWPVVHRLYELDKCIVAHAVDHVIHFEHGLRKLDLAFNERFQGAPNHGAHGASHASDVDWKIDNRKVHHVHHTFGNVHRLIAHALEISIDLGDGKDKAQVNSHRLLHGKQVKRRFIDLALGSVNQALAFQHHLATRQITLYISLARAIHRLLRQSSHTKQSLP